MDDSDGGNQIGLAVRIVLFLSMFILLVFIVYKLAKPLLGDYS